MANDSAENLMRHAWPEVYPSLATNEEHGVELLLISGSEMNGVNGYVLQGTSSVSPTYQGKLCFLKNGLWKFRPLDEEEVTLHLLRMKSPAP